MNGTSNWLKLLLQILSTKLLAKRSNLKLKSVTIIHSATTETVRLPENNNGVIVHTAVRTKVPFKKKVRGERSKKPGASLGTAAAATGSAAAGRTNGVSKTGGNAEPKTKSSRAHALAKKKLKSSLTEEEQAKKANKKLGKHIKETIDYSHRNNNATGIDDASTLSATANNTFGKVQKWLLESPIVAQPLSHIEHSSRVRNVMSKSQSTPERLVQKTPQKTKSMGNLSNEKVKLQVVYKPPFKFSLRLSKKPKVKTHVVGVSAGARPKRAQKSTARSSGQAALAAAAAVATTSNNKGQGGSERTKRTALLMCNEAEDDNQILTLNEPNYETLKPPTRTSSSTEHCYENVELPGASLDAAGSSKAKIAHSSSRTSVDPAAVAAAQRNSYRRSNSLSTHNPFAVAPRRSSNKVSKTESQAAGGGSAGGSINLTRNFGSTQNLINLSQGMAKSKKRSSLNLKAASAAAKNGKDPPTAAAPAAPPQRRSTSNSNLRRNSSVSNSQPHAAPVPPTRNTRNSFSNIPRASLNGGQSSSSSSAAAAAVAAASAAPPSFSRQSSSSTTTTASSLSTSGAGALQQSASASAMASQRQFVQPIRRSLNNFRTRSTAATTTASPALESNSNELPSDLEVVVSDIENLVS